MAETTFQGLIEELEKYLEFERDEGAVRLEVDPAVLEALSGEPDVVEPERLEVDSVPVPADFKTLDDIAVHVRQCRSCPLCAERTHAVPGEGNVHAPDIMFVGEGPGADEDAQGRPFVGKAGQLLDRMIEAMGYRREEVFIANVVKCRPPGNRKPTGDEMEMCLPYLRHQIRLIAPKIIIGLGGTAMEGLLGRPVAITRIRGIWQEYQGIRLMPTFHPSYLLRDSSRKKDAWQDLQEVLSALGRKPPPRK